MGPDESSKSRGILYVFPAFRTARMGQKSRLSAADDLFRDSLDLAGRNFEAGQYTEAAMFYLAVINYRVNCITPAEIRRITRQCEEALIGIGASQYDDLNHLPVSRIFLICDALPSFKAFATRAFVDGKAHHLDTGVEPPYLNRNWLMHGRMTRLVEKYECIQLINALSTLIEIEKTCAQ